MFKASALCALIFIPISVFVFGFLSGLILAYLIYVKVVDLMMLIYFLGMVLFTIISGLSEKEHSLSYVSALIVMLLSSNLIALSIISGDQGIVAAVLFFIISVVLILFKGPSLAVNCEKGV